MYWKGLTTRGAMAGGYLGLVSAVGLTILSPSIWHDVLGIGPGIFPYNAPALFSMPLAFIACYVVSVMGHEPLRPHRGRAVRRPVPSARRPASARKAPSPTSARARTP